MGLPAGWLTVKVKLVVPPMVRSALKALLTVGVVAATVTQAPALGVTPLVALGVIEAVIFVVVPMLLFVLAFGANVQAPTVGVAEVVTGTMIVQDVAGLTSWRPATTILPLPATAVTVPPVQVPITAAPLAAKPAGKVSVKVNVCVGLLAGWVIVNVRSVLPPTTKSPPNTLFTVGTAAFTVTHAPVVLVPLVALLVMAETIFVTLEIALLPLVLFACGHAPMVGVALTITGTIIVQVAAGLTIWRPATTILLLPAAAVTLPPLQVPIAAAPLATKPAGNVSVKLKVCVGLPVGCVTVKVRLTLPPPTVNEPLNALFRVGLAAETVRLADAVLPFNGPAAETIPDVLL